MRTVGNYAFDFEAQKWERRVTLDLYVWLSNAQNHIGGVKRNW